MIRVAIASVVMVSSQIGDCPMGPSDFVSLPRGCLGAMRATTLQIARRAESPPQLLN